jgi:hypothetical protein
MATTRYFFQASQEQFLGAQPDDVYTDDIHVLPALRGARVV